MPYNNNKMDIIKDNRTSTPIYADKANYHFANDNEILKLVNVDKSDVYTIISKIIGTSCFLNEESIHLLAIIIKSNENKHYLDLKKFYMEIYKKSDRTFGRALQALVDKEIVNIDLNNIVSLNEDYNFNNDISKADFIVIEINPFKTSSLIGGAL